MTTHGHTAGATAGANTRVTSLAAGNAHALALRADGTVLGWGQGSAAEVPADLAGVTAIAAGGNFSLALKDDGTVVNWGSQGLLDYRNGAFIKSEMRADPLTRLTAVTSIAIGSSGCHLALREDGTVVSWVPDERDHFKVPYNLAGVRSVAVGNSWCAAVMRDTSVRVWGGQHFFGQDKVPDGLIGVTEVAVGGSCCFALRSDGSLVAWGHVPNDRGNLVPAYIPDGLANVTQVAAVDDYVLALTAEGSVVGWGYDPLDQLAVPTGLTGVIAFSGAPTAVLLFGPMAL
jgi:alpha-tubulin suppressor-like RCC1 family protein